MTKNDLVKITAFKSLTSYEKNKCVESINCIGTIKPGTPEMVFYVVGFVNGVILKRNQENER